MPSRGWTPSYWRSNHRFYHWCSRKSEDLVSDKQLVISIVAGIPTSQIAAQLQAQPPIVRTMPNTPALIGLGITGMYARVNCNLAQRELTQNLMESAGEVVWLDKESLLDVVTAVSGSGPAYFYYLVECLRNAGTRLGLPPKWRPSWLCIPPMAPVPWRCKVKLMSLNSASR